MTLLIDFRQKWDEDESMNRLNEQRVQSRTGHVESICVTATFTAEPLMEFLAFWAREFGWLLRVEFSPLGQVFQHLLGATDESAKRNSGIRLVLLRIADWDQGSASLEQTASEFIVVLRRAVEQTSLEHLICLCPISPHLTEDPSISERIKQAEAILINGLDAVPHTTLLWAIYAAEQYGVQNYYDDASDRLAGIAYSTEFYAAVATYVFRKIAALRRTPLKVIACDCDNTIWQGVVAEDGIDRLHISDANRKLSGLLSDQKRKGVLLCLCSKNELVDIVRTFECRADIGVRLDDFVTKRINWSKKSENLRSLAAELQLGLDSFVFIDDDPVECAEVRLNCPEVVTFQFPTSDDGVSCMDHFWMFDSVSATAEGQRRTDLYLQDQLRQETLQTFNSLEEYIESLQLKVEVSPLQLDQLSRVVELLYRTNQFNTTNFKKSVPELRVLLESHALDGRTYKVIDKFGDYGLVGVVLFSERGRSLNVEAVLLSCRALGRGVEYWMAADCGRIAIERGLPEIAFHFSPSARNKPARIFLERAIGNAEVILDRMQYRISAEVGAAIRPTYTIAIPNGEDHKGQGEAGLDQATASKGLVARSELFKHIAECYRTASSIVAAARGTLPTSSHPGNPQPLETQTEISVAKIWREILRVEISSASCSFFDLGGDSLKAIRVLSRIQDTFKIQLPLALLFEDKLTIATMCSAIDQVLHECAGRSNSG